MSSEMLICTSCGNRMPANVRFCPECGHINAAHVASGQTEPVSSERDITVSGTPTVDIGSPGVYTPPPPVYSDYPMQPQGQPQEQGGYAPPSQYGQTQSFQQGALPPQSPGPGYGNYSPAPMNYQYRPQVGVGGTPPRDSAIALLLELIGYAGFLGIGHIYAGRTGRGIALMIAWWFYGFVAIILMVTIILTIFGCLMLLAVPVVPLLSGLWVKHDLDREQATLGQRYR